MSDDVWKGRACSGIPKNVGGIIKRGFSAELRFTLFLSREQGHCRPFLPRRTLPAVLRKLKSGQFRL
jgi:hypothetical protein